MEMTERFKQVCFWLVFATILTVYGSLRAATYSLSITTTARQEAALSYMRTQINAQRARQTPPDPALADNTALLNFIVGNLLADFQARERENLSDRLGTAYQTATPAVQSQVKTLLGIP
jgi:hypothetical protein